MMKSADSPNGDYLAAPGWPERGRLRAVFAKTCPIGHSKLIEQHFDCVLV
jgi:hypothetical protein